MLLTSQFNFVKAYVHCYLNISASCCSYHAQDSRWCVWKHIVMPEVQTVKQLLSKSIHYAGGANSCFLKTYLLWRYKQLLYKSTPYAWGTSSSCFL